jgi:asparagine synthetase A
MTTGKVADLAGPGIGNYEELEEILPEEHSSLLTRRETQKAIFTLKRFIEDNLSKHLNLMMVTVPLISTTAHAAAPRTQLHGHSCQRSNSQAQLEISGQLDFLQFPYHHAIAKHEIPLSIGGGIGQSRTMMLEFRKAHLGEVTVSVWPKILKEICAKKNINALE